MDSLLSLFNPYASLLIAALLPYIPHAIKVPAVNAKLRMMIKTNNGEGRGKYSLKNPRQATLAAIDDTPEGQFIYRCQNCHQNALESFPVFAVGMLGGLQGGVDSSTLHSMGCIYIVSRLLYTYFYCYGTNTRMAMMRSTVWTISMVAPLYILYKAITVSSQGKS